jgi:hypothetical protein
MEEVPVFGEIPPSWDPGPSAEHFLPEPYYFSESGPAFVESVTRTSATVISRWATRYEARGLQHPDAARAGDLPEDPQAREESTRDVLDWLGQLDEPWTSLAIDLYRDSFPILYQGDRPPGILALTQPEFLQVQSEWERLGLPRDLYYPSRTQQMVVEPVRVYGGIVLAEVRYSPLQWSHRVLSSSEALEVPSQQERAQAFQEACAAFRRALLLRVFELSEPGRPRDPEAISMLGRLATDITRVALRAGVKSDSAPAGAAGSQRDDTS